MWQESHFTLNSVFSNSFFRHAMPSLVQYQELAKNDFSKPLTVQAPESISAYIDVDKIFSPTDKLSQINTLMQMQNMASYKFVQNYIKEGKAQIHAMWYDIFSGEIYYFSKKQKVNKITVLRRNLCHFGIL